MCNEGGEVVKLWVRKGNVEERNGEVFNVLRRRVLGEVLGEKGYM